MFYIIFFSFIYCSFFQPWTKYLVLDASILISFHSPMLQILQGIQNCDVTLLFHANFKIFVFKFFMTEFPIIYKPVYSLCKPMDWFLYGRGMKEVKLNLTHFTSMFYSCTPWKRQKTIKGTWSYNLIFCLVCLFSQWIVILYGLKFFYLVRGHVTITSY